MESEVTERFGGFCFYWSDDFCRQNRVVKWLMVKCKQKFLHVSWQWLRASQCSRTEFSCCSEQLLNSLILIPSPSPVSFKWLASLRVVNQLTQIGREAWVKVFSPLWQVASTEKPAMSPDGYCWNRFNFLILLSIQFTTDKLPLTESWNPYWQNPPHSTLAAIGFCSA